MRINSARSPSLPLPSSAFPPQPDGLSGGGPDAPVPVLLTRSLQHAVNHSSLLQALPETIPQVFPFDSKISSSHSVEDPAQRLISHAPLCRDRASSQVCQLGNRVSSAFRRLSVVVEPFRDRDLGREPRWEEATTKVESDGSSRQ